MVMTNRLSSSDQSDALSRWENEGGSFQPSKHENRHSDKERAGADNRRMYSGLIFPTAMRGMKNRKLTNAAKRELMEHA